MIDNTLATRLANRGICCICSVVLATCCALGQQTMAPEDVPVDMSLAAFTGEGEAFAQLRKLSTDFDGLRKTIEGEYEKAHETLVGQVKEALRKTLNDRKAAGDYDAVLVYEAAVKSDKPIDTSDKSLLSFYEKVAVAEAKLAKNRDGKMAKIVDSLCSQLDAITVRETKAGKMDVAREAKAYRERAAALGQALRARIEAYSADTTSSVNQTAKPQDKQVEADAESKQATPLTGRFSFENAPTTIVIVQPDKESGSPIGGEKFEKGDLLVIQFTGGTVARNHGAGPAFSPDARDGQRKGGAGGRRSQVRIEGPVGAKDKVSRHLPFGTESAPYVFDVPESGYYRLIGFFGPHAQGKSSYQIVRINKVKAQKFRDSPHAIQCQW